MKRLLGLLLVMGMVGCGESQQSAPPETPTSETVTEVPTPPSPPAEAKPVEPVAEGPKPESTTFSSTQIGEATFDGNIKAVKQHIADGADVNAMDDDGWTPLHYAALDGYKDIADLLIAKGADVNAKAEGGLVKGKTPLDLSIRNDETETAKLLREHGGKTSEELKAEGK